jgi:L-alanine-DL-glutamate epimerase-like enolase superfamily enzyme
MSTQHTPGPWIGAGPSFGDQFPRYTTEITTEDERYGDGHIQICELPFHHHDEENEANARLIAAAPDLLGALQNMLAQYNTVHGTGDMEMQSAIDFAHKAIAKATGETK